MPLLVPAYCPLLCIPILGLVLCHRVSFWRFVSLDVPIYLTSLSHHCPRNLSHPAPRMLNFNSHYPFLLPLLILYFAHIGIFYPCLILIIIIISFLYSFISLLYFQQLVSVPQ